MEPKKPLFETRPGVCRVQVYVPVNVAKHLQLLSEMRRVSVSRLAAEFIEDMLQDLTTGAKVLPAPGTRRYQDDLA